MRRALLIVDYQYDFAHPQGKLYVPQAEMLFVKINELINQFNDNNDLVIATKDWHPNNHYSFNQWGEHCVQNTLGAQLYQLNESKIDKIILKGQNKDKESYSGFFDETNQSNGLIEYLQTFKITELVIVGVALDICLSATLTDAIKHNFHGYVDLECTRGIQPIIKF